MTELTEEQKREARWKAEEREHYVTDETAARICWAAIREVFVMDGLAIPTWDEVGDEARILMLKDVCFVFENPTADMASQHAAWWVRHNQPGGDFVPYDKLAFAGQLKHRLVRHICHAFAG